MTFNEVLEEYRATVRAMELLMRDAVKATGTLREAKMTREQCEADLVLNPGIDGKNADLRAAQLTKFKGRDAEYLHCLNAENTEEDTLALIKNDLEIARHNLRGYLAEMTYLQSVQGNENPLG